MGALADGVASSHGMPAANLVPRTLQIRSAEPPGTHSNLSLHTCTCRHHETRSLRRTAARELVRSPMPARRHVHH